MKFAFGKILACLLCVFLLADTVTLSAAIPMPEVTEPKVQQVFLDRYELTDEKIIPGKEFTLKLFLKNVSDKSIEHVIVDVMYPLGIMPIYGSVSQAIVDVDAGETTEVALRYNALEKIGSPILDFQVSLRENELQNLTVLRTPVGLQSPFDIVSFFIPTKAMEGESVNCSMTFKYLGIETADKVSARMNVNGVLAYAVDLGNMTKETTKTQSLFKSFDQEGTYSVELYLDYHDDAGKKKTMKVGSGSLEVLEVPSVSASAAEQMEKSQQENQRSNRSLVLMAGGILIAVIFAIIVFLIRKKK